MSIINTNNAKKNILKKIKSALQEYQAPMPYPELGQLDSKALFDMPKSNDLVSIFSENYKAAGGILIDADNAIDFIDKLNALVIEKKWNNLICAHMDLFSYLMSAKVPYIKEYDLKPDGIDACITDCELAVARTGSFILTSAQNYGRTSSIYHPVHIVILQPHQIVGYLQDALKLMKQKYNHQLPSMINLNTGPSRTADIEKTLVTGIHGPKEIYCFIIHN